MKLVTVSSSLNVSLFVGVATARRGAICTWIGCINKQEPPLPEPINRRGSRGKPGSFTCCVKCPLTGMERWLSTNTPSGAFPPMAASGTLYFTHAGLRSSCFHFQALMMPIKAMFMLWFYVSLCSKQSIKSHGWVCFPKGRTQFI